MARAATTTTKTAAPQDGGGTAVMERPKEGTALSTGNALLPSFMQGSVGAGLENVGSADIETPRIKLLQSNSPELEEFDEAKAGMFWHSVAGISLGRELTIVPIYVDQRAILWRPRESGGGILARADDGMHWNPPNATFDVTLAPKQGGKQVKWSTKPTVIQSRLLEWGTSNPEDPNSQPAATKMYSIVAACPSFGELPPGVITLQRSAIRVAKKLLGQLKLSRAPAFGCKFIMSSTREEGPSGAFYNYKFTPAGFVEDEVDFRNYEQAYMTLREMGLQLRDIDLEPDAEPSDKDDGNQPVF